MSGLQVRATELAARIEELNAVAGHLPAHLVAGRLVCALDDFFEEAKNQPSTRNIAGRFEPVGARAVKTVAVSDIAARTIASGDSGLAAEEEPEQKPEVESAVRAKPVAERAARKLGETVRQVTIYPHPDTGEPTSSPDFIGDPDPSEEGEPESSETEEPEKPCNECGATKKLSEFPKNYTFKDGRTNKCKDCTNAAAARWRMDRRARPSEAAGTPDEAGEQKERHCAKGSGCVHFEDPFGEPAKLGEKDPGPYCPDCARRAGLAS